MPRTIGTASGQALKVMLGDAVKARGYNLRQLAEMTGIRPGTIGGMLYGDVRGSIEAWARLLDAAGVELAWQLKAELD